MGWPAPGSGTGRTGALLVRFSTGLMSDESSRSAHPRQRRSDGAPAWWAALDRVDLPDDAGDTPASHPQWYPDLVDQQPPIRRVAGVEGLPSRWRAWFINLAVVAVAVLLVMLGVGVTSPREALTVGLLFGVPIMLVAITATIAARRAR
jgi:hypothetical protein